MSAQERVQRPVQRKSGRTEQQAAEEAAAARLAVRKDVADTWWPKEGS